MAENARSNILLVALALTAVQRGANADPATESVLAGPAASSVESYELGRGMRAILEPSGGGEEVAVCTGIGVGSAAAPVQNRALRRTLGKLLEQGGSRADSPDPGELVRARGGENSVSFERDALIFCSRVPRNELPLALWVAATRFSSLSVAEDTLVRTREDLSRELSMALSDTRGQASRERVDRMVHLGESSFLPTSEEVLLDLETASLEGLTELHKTLFVAENTTLTISGAFEVEIARQLVEKHLGKLPSGAGPTRRSEGYLQSTERFSTAEDPVHSGTSVWYAWRSPSGHDGIVAELALRILGSPSRLGAALSGPGGPASSVEIAPDAHAGEVLRIFVQGRGNYAPEPIEDRLDKALSSLAATGPSQSELDEAQRALVQASRERLVTPRDRAHELARGALGGLPPELVLQALGEDESWAKASRDEISAIIRSSLTKRKRSVVEVYPKGWKDPWETPIPSYHVVSSGETLSSIALARGTTVDVIARMNRLDAKKAIFPGDKLKVPRGKPAPKLRTHLVRSGDTLLGLAKRYGVPARSIAEQNGLGSKQVIRIGQTLEVPNGGAVSSKEAKGESSEKAPKPTRQHEVKKGDSLGSVAKKWGVTITELCRANGLGNQARLKIGQTLVIPSAETSKTPLPEAPSKKAAPIETPSKKAAPAEIPSKPKAAPRTHVVKGGETLSGIAHKYHVSTRALCQANGISEKKPLRVGHKLTIPE